MNLTTLMKRNMPHREINANECIKFSGSLAESFGTESGKNDAVALNTLILTSMSNSYVEGSSRSVGA